MGKLYWICLIVFLSACTSLSADKDADETKNATFISPQWNQQLGLYVHNYFILGETERAGAILNLFSEQERSHLLQTDINYIALYGVYLIQTKQLNKAILHYEAAIEYFPENVNLMNNYGMALLMERRYIEACNWFNKAVLLSYETLQSALINISRCELSKKNVNKSLNYLKQAKEIAKLPYIGLLTELNLVLIQGNLVKAQRIYDSLQVEVNKVYYIEYKSEYECLARQLKLTDIDVTVNSFSQPSLCLGFSRY